MEIIRDILQGSDKWHALRCGSIGGSQISDLMAQGRGLTREKLLYQKADEILSGKPSVSYQNYDMILGIEAEPLTRAAYSLEREVEIEQVAMIKNGDHKHVSPDGLVGVDGIVEIKNTNGPNYLTTILKGEVPAEHVPQIQWSLGKSEREWCDLIMASWMRPAAAIISLL